MRESPMELGQLGCSKKRGKVMVVLPVFLAGFLQGSPLVRSAVDGSACRKNGLGNIDLSSYGLGDMVITPYRWGSYTYLCCKLIIPYFLSNPKFFAKIANCYSKEGVDEVIKNNFATPKKGTVYDSLRSEIQSNSKEFAFQVDSRLIHGVTEQMVGATKAGIIGSLSGYNKSGGFFSSYYGDEGLAGAFLWFSLQTAVTQDLSN